MTTLMVVDGFGQGETRSQAVTRRLREELGRHKTTVAAVARSLGEVQQKYSRKMTNQTPWDVDSLDRFCGAFGGDFNYVTTGVREIPDPKGPGQGGDQVSERSTVQSCQGARRLRLITGG